MVEVEISKLHKKIVMNKYSTWSPCFHTIEGGQLKGLIDIVNAKIQACNHKISILKNMQQGEKNSLIRNKTQENVASSHSSQLDLIHSIPQQQHIYGDPTELVNDNINEMMSLTNFFSLPCFSLTNQINKSTKLENMMVEPHQEWANQLDEFLQLDDRVVEPGNWTSNLVNFSQPNLFALRDISYMS
ncbi:uncharacterized protein LOC131631814 [Vicia villosa]|uniref:uncharacterized protein LOC131631814 n=1 Tax=Vicia villosa TaxID=3911 RepID=UPI00273CABEF|nr:uncharacterized protein LOC131631814 [Vicia villosa]